jgi:hypothetical protein
MWYTVRKGQNRFKPIRVGLFPRLEFEVLFDFSCRYHIGADQTDTNKLFGVGYFPGHHTHSARFGWEYDPQQDKILLSAYVYSKGVRIDQPIGYVAFGRKVKLAIAPDDRGYQFFIMDGHFSRHTTINCKRPWLKIGYRLGPYFGGNQKATHEMKIEMI